MAGTPNHSTLELNHRRSDKDTSGIEVDPRQPDGTSDIEARPRQPVYTPGIEVHEQQIYNDASIPEVYYYNNPEVWRPEGYGIELPTGSAPQSNQEDSNPKANGKKTVFGVSRRIFIIGLIVGLVIIGVIAGGVAGGLRNRRSTATNATNSILKVSKLAAANRTMSSGQSHRTVVFQDGSGALLSRRRLVSSSTWSTINITRDFENRTNPVVIPNGTPLAAMGCQDWGCGDTSVFYLGTDGLIHGLIDDNSLGYASWTYVPAVSNANLSAWVGSQLTTVISKRFRSDGHLVTDKLVAYHGDDKFIHVANGSSSFRDPRKLENDLPNLARDTCLAIITQLRGVVLDQLSLVAKSIGTTSTSHINSAMIEARYAVEGDDWTPGTTVLDGDTLSELPSSTGMQQFAVTMRNNWTESVYIVLLSDGTIAGRILGQHNETMSSIQLKDPGGQPRVANFSAIATTMDGFLYGIANDTINEYSFDASDPSILNFEGVVYSESVMEEDMARKV